MNYLSETGWGKMPRKGKHKDKSALLAPVKRRRCTVDVPGLGRLDGRTREALAFGEIVRELAEDLGGLEVLSRAQLEHARRAAAMGIICSRIEASLMQGEDVDIATLVAAANAQSRILDRLGLERRARDVTPDPLAYARAKDAEDRAEDAEIARLAEGDSTS